MPRTKPCKINSSKYLINDHWLTLHSDSYTTAAGDTVEPYYVQESSDWVHVVCFNEHEELLKETGYEVSKLEKVVSHCPNPSTHTNRVHTVRGEELRWVSEQKLDISEDIEVCFLPWKDVLQRVVSVLRRAFNSLRREVFCSMHGGSRH